MLPFTGSAIWWKLRRYLQACQKVMAAYCQVCGVIHFTSPVGWLPVHRDHLRAQRSVTSMGKLYLYLTTVAAVASVSSSTLTNLPRYLAWNWLRHTVFVFQTMGTFRPHRCSLLLPTTCQCCANLLHGELSESSADNIYSVWADLIPCLCSLDILHFRDRCCLFFWSYFFAFVKMQHFVLNCTCIECANL